MVIRPIKSKPVSIALSVGVSLFLSLWGNLTLAADPFRQSNPRNIGEKTEAAFDELFEKGNYKEAKRYLIEAETSEASEPMAHAMRASLAYLEKDWETMKMSADKTFESAQGLKEGDPLRGNLYLAIGHFLQGAYVYQQDKNPVQALTTLQKVLEYLDEAEKVSPDDPELNLVKGYLDLILAVNLPFSSPDRAIERFEKYAAPEYLVDRGIAVAYRDLKQHDKALQFIDKALQSTPDNPELQYLKGQILRNIGKRDKNVSLLKQANEYYEKALTKQDQLPQSILTSLNYEHGKIQKEMQEIQTGGA